MTKMDNSFVGYIALLGQLASFYKGWVGDHCRDHSIFIMTYMDSRGWGEPTPPIYIYMSIIIYINILAKQPPSAPIWENDAFGGVSAQKI